MPLLGSSVYACVQINILKSYSVECSLIVLAQWVSSPLTVIDLYLFSHTHLHHWIQNFGSVLDHHRCLEEPIGYMYLGQISNARSLNLIIHTISEQDKPWNSA